MGSRVNRGSLGKYVTVSTKFLITHNNHNNRTVLLRGLAGRILKLVLKYSVYRFY